LRIKHTTAPLFDQESQHSYGSDPLSNVTDR
jgi:hypothetical protein